MVCGDSIRENKTVCAMCAMKLVYCGINCSNTLHCFSYPVEGQLEQPVFLDIK
jgi:hypothetical protein